MKFALFGLLASTALAAPAQTALSNNDVAVLQLAHYLENLEYSLYSAGCKKYSDADYKAAGLTTTRSEICTIARHEATHRDTLASVLRSGGQKPLPKCTYKFPYNDPTSFVDVANMITSGGIGAYLGAAQLVTDNDSILTAAASILSTEARHDSILRAGLGGRPFPSPFDTAITPLWIFSIVQQFIVSCPMQPPGYVTLPKLTLASPAPSPDLTPIPAGTTLTFTWDPSTFFVNVDPSTPVYIAIVNQNVQAPKFRRAGTAGAGRGSIALPKGTAGAAFAVLTTFKGNLNENQLSKFGTLAGPALIIAS